MKKDNRNWGHLLDGKTPTSSSIVEVTWIRVETKDGHVLTEKEWSDVVGDNVVIMGELRNPVSKYKISELVFIEETK